MSTEGEETASTPAKKLYPVKFVWDHGGDRVFLNLTSPPPDATSRTIELRRQPEGQHETLVALAVGRHEYRFSVDSEWTFDRDLPALKTDQGHYSNMIKVKIPSFNEPQWNKTPKEENLMAAAKAATQAATMNPTVKTLKAKAKRPQKSASSSKIAPAATPEAERKLSKSKSTSKVQQPKAKIAKKEEKPLDVKAEAPKQELAKCLSGDDTLLLSAAGDNVRSQADTFVDDENQDTFPEVDDSSIISDEEMPDLEEAFVTAASGKTEQTQILIKKFMP